MGIFSDLESFVGDISDGTSDLLGEGGLGGLLGDDADGLLQRGLDALGDEAGGWLSGQAGGLASDLLGDEAGGLVGGWLSDEAGGLVSGWLGDEAGGLVSSWLGDSGGGVVNSLLGDSAGDWGDSIGQIVDTVAGGDGGAILDQLSGLLPDDVQSALGDAGSWGGALLDTAAGATGTDWLDVAGSAIGSALGDTGFDSLVQDGLDGLAGLGIAPDDLGLDGRDVAGLLDDGLDAIGLDGAGDVVDTGLDLIGDTVEAASPTDALDVADPVDHAAWDAPLESDADAAGSFDDLGMATDAVDVTAAQPEVMDVEPAPLDDFDEAIQVADTAESSVDDMFEGL
jgi:hypothetical protein